MKLLNYKKVWICKPVSSKLDGEYSTVWNYTKHTHLNLQQDFNELDRNSAGEIDYTIYKGRTTKETGIENGDGICLTDISSSTNIVPEYIATKIQKIGKTITYTLKKNGE